MFNSLQVFQLREPFDLDYQAPSIDSLADEVSSSSLVILPLAPVAVSLDSGGFTFETVENADGYQLEQLVSVNTWEFASQLISPAPSRIIWTGFEWLIESFEVGAWVAKYSSSEDVSTPDLVQEWHLIGEESSIALPITHVEPESGGDEVLVADATPDSLNTYYLIAGNLNGKHYYQGPAQLTIEFTPTAGMLYRVRAFNLAGKGPASNPLVGPVLFDCGGNPSDVLSLVWDVINSPASGSNANGSFVSTLNAVGAVVELSVEEDSFHTGAGFSPGICSVEADALICNSSLFPRTLRIIVSDLVFNFVANQDGNTYISSPQAYLQVLVNGIPVIAYFAIQTDNLAGPTVTGPNLVLTAILPAQAISVIQAQCVADLSGNTESGDQAKISATLTFSIDP